MSRVNKTLDKSKKSANKRGEDLIIRRFLSSLLREKGNVIPGDDYNYDPVDDITDKISSAKLKEIPLEETICKVLQSELKLIFPAHFFQDSAESNSSSLIASKQIVAPMESKMVSQNNIPLASKDSSPDDHAMMNFLPPRPRTAG
ncbi:4360_t:CDS:2 [Funneliformis geosporum]|uniref:4360_t:CDS:1 n=1 Tax=Funneliformis geosporum TaxID=1117311 RepID=A0A9W4SYM7_9GLOM|nr:4360_t:CDS:2 [Funneliformis geosporum]